MKLATVRQGNDIRIGAVVDESVLDLSHLIPHAPWDLTQLLTLDDGPRRLQATLASPLRVWPMSEVRLLAPILRPRKFLALGANYRCHVREMTQRGIVVNDRQTWFNKQVTCVSGPYDAIRLPAVSNQLDYEAELAIVIGKRCRGVAARDACTVIAGYMVCNDVSVRDWQLHSPTWTLGKSFDTHGPTGPWLVTADEIPDPHGLGVRCYVNNVLTQIGTTADMIHSCWEMIEYLSTAFTLEPGDILATGTPAGVGALMQPPKFLQAGDVVRCEVDRIGYIENIVTEEGPFMSIGADCSGINEFRVGDRLDPLGRSGSREGKRGQS